MGFDIYGVEPKENTEKPKILNKDFFKLDSDTREKYFAVNEKWKKENPGIYFRNNVWWWRPLWNYVCNICEDVMTEEEIDAGGDNSGNKISESTVQRMVDKLIVEVALQNHVKHEKEYSEELKNAPDVGCDLCEGTGTRNDKYVKFKDTKCNACNGKGERRPFSSNYPFSAKNLEEFIEFLQQSGGIQIC